MSEMENRGGPIPEELTARAKSFADAGFEDWFNDYAAMISKNATKPVDLGAFAHNFRSQYGWPNRGSILGHANSSEEMDFVLTRIDDLSGNVPLLEAIFMQAVLDNGDGPEARFLKERQKRGYTSLYENEACLQWRAKPGFYEMQLQRRHNNVLFPPPKRTVSRNDLYIARKLDDEELMGFIQEWKEFLDTFIHGADIVSSSTAVNSLHKLYGLLEKAAAIGGDVDSQVAQIHNAYQGILEQLYESFKTNPEATRTLKSAEEIRWSGSDRVVLNTRITQLQRTPDKADVVPALLSEDLDTIRSTVEVLTTGKTNSLEAVRSVVLKMMNDSSEVSDVLRHQPQKLEALGISSDGVTS